MNKEQLIKKYGLEKPYRIRDEKKKYAVLVKNKKTGNVNVVKFGAVGYDDYLSHGDKNRRENFRARHRCSEKTNKLTAGWWSCNWSWG